MAGRSLSLVLVLLLSAAGTGSQADQEYLLAGIVDVELYDTDASSVILARNGGEPAALGRLELWGALQLGGNWQAYALAETVTNDFAGSWQTHSKLEQLALRWSNHAAHFLVVDIGKFLTPSSAFMARNLSNQNPLIGEPESIYAGYPRGIQLTANTGWLDYRAALVDAPWIKPGYLPAEPGTAYRPDVGVGVTPMAGLRLGLSYTAGPYLNRALEAFLPAGVGWRDLEQRVTGLELQFSRGYLAFNGMALRSRYDLPFRSRGHEGTSYVAELAYTWTPRFYTALRLERNEYPFIRHQGGSGWLIRTVVTHDLEVGMAYRFDPDTQLKVSYRRDRWSVAYGQEDRFPDGHWVALQLSHRFDLQDLLGPAR